MLKTTATPPLPRPGPHPPAFTQTITLQDEKTTVASAVWHAPSNIREGSAQLLDLATAPHHRRQGYGGELLRAVVEQASTYYQARGSKLRRIWIVLGHRSQVQGRAFLTSAGFHHTHTVSNVHADEDLLVYVKSYD